jgi:hypothetical protein
MAEDVVFDAKPILRALNELEPGLRTQMLRDMKDITKPMVSEIRSVIPKTSPMSGMSETKVARGSGGLNSDKTGRLNWEAGKYKNRVIAPDNVIPRLTSGRSRKVSVTSLFGVWLRSPGVAMVATAGKGSGTPRANVSREYSYKGGKRRHTLNGQGAALIRRVKTTGLYNFFYIAAGKKIPDTQQRVKLVWETYSAKVNRKL